MEMSVRNLDGVDQFFLFLFIKSIQLARLVHPDAPLLTSIPQFLDKR